MHILWENISSPPVIELQIDEKELFTILIIDPDAPNPPYLHLWYQNVSLTNKGDIISTYMKPSPPDNKMHRYNVLVYAQNNKLRMKPKITQRTGFDLSKLGFKDADLRASKVYQSNGITLSS